MSLPLRRYAATTTSLPADAAEDAADMPAYIID